MRTPAMHSAKTILLLSFTALFSCSRMSGSGEVLVGKKFIKYWVPKYNKILEDEHIKKLIHKKDRTKELTQLSRIGLSMLSFSELNRKRLIAIKIINGMDSKSCEGLFSGKKVTDKLLLAIDKELSDSEQEFWGEASYKSIMFGSVMNRNYRPAQGRLSSAMRELFKSLSDDEKHIYRLITEGKKPLNQMGKELCEFNKIIHERVTQLSEINQAQILQAFVFDFVFTLES